VGLVERPPAEPGSDDAGETEAFADVFVQAAERVVDDLVRGLGFRDLVVEFGELATG
jgi:hypothetical protein